jgi:O-antigen biosynthesis protein WbqP
MSFVGPRPVVLNEYDLIVERDKYGANDIRPGLTGWAQINGRDELTPDVKARIDGEYVKEMSFKNDLVCLLKTIPVILKQDGFVEGATASLAHQEVAVTEEAN